MAVDGTRGLVHPFIFLACTYNLWNTERWDERKRPLRRFLEIQRPDILCVQELSQAASDLILDALPSLRRVDDPFSGWRTASNIYWNAELFELVEYGAEDVGILETDRRLFWVRLVSTSGASLVVATAHFSWTGNIREIAENVNVRVDQAQRCADALASIVPDDEPVLFMGDFNDYIHPLRILRYKGFDDSFMALGREAVTTYPTFPLAQQPPELLDWMMHRGPIRPTLTSVVDFYVGEFPPSDHKPVLTTYELERGGSGGPAMTQ
ncbi:MAG: endonuclease [Actinobacteria bacterium]|nr:endonuclease [Actinomycetota bacterium]